MKRTTLFLFACCAVLTSKAQHVTDSVALDVVTVEAARVTNTPDGQRYYPTQTQLEHSATTYHLLQQLALPSLTVDPVLHSVTPPPMQGAVQIRINDVVASADDLLALNPRDIERVDYTDHPSVRYGEGVGYVINVVARRPTHGYETGGDAGVSSRKWIADVMAYGKWNVGLSEWQLTASADVKDFSRSQRTEQARYRYADGTTLDVQRDDLPDSRRQRNQNQQLALRYSFVRPQQLTLQAALSGDWEQGRASQQATLSSSLSLNSPAGSPSTASSYSPASNAITASFNPTLDLYAALRLSPRQQLIVNLVGSAMRSHYDYAYHSFSPFGYAATGRTHSLQGEALYVNKLKPFTLSVGLNFQQKYVENDYSGDAAVLNAIRQSDERLFAQLKGTLGQTFSYRFGLDLRRQYYRQGSERQDELTLAPKLTLQQSLGDFRLTYDGSMQSRPPRLEHRSAVLIRDNEWEATVGNPQLRNEQWWEHSLSLTRQSPRLFLQTSVHYRDIIHARLTQTVQHDDGFLTTRRNQRRLRMFYATQYAQWWAVPERLQLSGNVGLYRFLNHGNDYVHALSFWAVSLDASAYLGRFTLSAHYDNGWRFVEGEQQSHNAGGFYLGASCQLPLPGAGQGSGLTVVLYWQQPLQRSVRLYDTTFLNRDVWKHTVLHSRDTANLLNLSVSWRFGAGRTSKSVQREVQLRDNDSGVVRQAE